jgi:predicted alpha/beta-fold hydrolase
VSLPSSTADPQGFRPRFPWLTGDLQTVRDALTRDDADPGASRRLWLELPDGDALAASLHEGNGPLVVLIHGLTGCEASRYVLRSRAFWARRGRAVLALNLRGSRPSLARSRRGYFAGAGADIAHALQALPMAHDGVVCVGYSLGGTQLFHALVHPAMPRVLAAATICAPVDLAAASARIMAPRNALYHRLILRRMQQDAAALGENLAPAYRQAAAAARTLRAFDEGYVAPANGFAGADDYYAQCSLAAVIGRIRAPLLCLTARDDPWIPAASYAPDQFAQNRRVIVRIVEGGGHVGFHDASRDGSFADRAVAAFFRPRER